MALLKLYHFSLSPPSRCALMTIRALNLDVEVEIVNLLNKEQLRPEFVAINPQHCIPTLDDNGFVLWESRAIASYLVNKYDASKKLYPSGDAKYTAKIDRLLYFDAGIVFPSIRAIVFPAVRMGERKVSAEKRDGLKRVFELLNTYLEGNKWAAGGSDFTIADISLFSSVTGIVLAGFDTSPYPNVQEWMKTCSVIPGYAENQTGATLYGNLVKGKLDPGEI